jgi:glycosyltransferase involved in cell wall biosynthesis
MTNAREALSVIVITLNEALDIEACLESVRGLANEVVVVDSGSTDGTPAMAERLGARVVRTDWPGFGPQKNRALALATHPWILSLDADERLTPELRASIEAVLASGDPAHTCAGYALSRRSQFCGHWVDHSGWSPDWVARLFRRESGRFSDDAVHERVLIDGPIGRLDGRLLHYSYRSRDEVDAKTQAYARAGARMMLERGKRVGALSPFFHGMFAFVRTFMLRAGFLDGTTGIAVARMNARASYLKYRHARDLAGQGDRASAANPSTDEPLHARHREGTYHGMRLGLSCQALRHAGGFERYARDVIDNLAGRGLRPIVFARKFDSTLPEYAGIDAQTIHVRWLPGSVRDFAFAWRFRTRRARSAADVVIACNRVDAAEIVVCGGTHPGALHHGRNRPRWNDSWQIALERRAYRNAHIVVAHSRMMAREVEQYFGITPDRIRVIHPPVRADRFTPVDDAQRAALRAGFGIPHGHAAFAFVANTGKGYDLLRAFFDTTPLPVCLLAAGRPIDGASGKIRYLGYRKDMENVFRAADFTIVPAPYEPFGLVGIESVLCGTPVLAARNVGCTEVIRDDAQWRFSHLEPTSFAAALDAALARWLAGNARLVHPRDHLLYDPDVTPHVTKLLELADEVAWSRRP